MMPLKEAECIVSNDYFTGALFPAQLPINDKWLINGTRESNIMNMVVMGVNKIQHPPLTKRMDP